MQPISRNGSKRINTIVAVLQDSSAPSSVTAVWTFGHMSCRPSAACRWAKAIRAGPATSGFGPQGCIGPGRRNPLLLRRPDLPTCPTVARQLAASMVMAGRNRSDGFTCGHDGQQDTHPRSFELVSQVWHRCGSRERRQGSRVVVVRSAGVVVPGRRGPIDLAGGLLFDVPAGGRRFEPPSL